MTPPLGSEPAFPHEQTLISTHSGPITVTREGLTKREWLAGTIAAGMWANWDWCSICHNASKKHGLDVYDTVGASAAKAADALLATLARPSPDPSPDGPSPAKTPQGA